MRIISQDGLSDYPYNYIVVFVNHLERNKIGAMIWGDACGDFELAEYNSDEDALYVMEAMRKAMKYGYDYFYMPSADYVPIMRKKAAEGGEL